jgi:hypothetical protein
MIESFRHEAMNQATVIAGFCEIIENLLLKNPGSFNTVFPPALKKVEQLVGNFNDTLCAFRNECAFTGVTEEIVMSLDPAGDITGFFSESCKIHFTVLREIAKELASAARSIDAVSIGNNDIHSRYCFVAESAIKLNDLFLFPIAFLQKMIEEHQN